MKISLTQTLVLHKLTIDHRPELDAKGRIVYIPNLNRTPYFVFDAHRDAPVGFGVKVSATKKTYLVQRRVGPTRVVKAKLGNVGDYPSIEKAREAAVELAARIKAAGGQNPNRLRREQADAARADTLGAAFAAYREHLVKRSKKRAKPATLEDFLADVLSISSARPTQCTGGGRPSFRGFDDVVAVSELRQCDWSRRSSNASAQSRACPVVTASVGGDEGGSATATRR